jgi:hypothetical protein
MRRREQVMIDIRSGLRSVANREKWAARGASFVAKAKATKVVWFPPEPVDTGAKAASTATKATKKATKKATSKATRQTAGRTTGAAKKATSATKKVTDPRRGKKS